MDELTLLKKRVLELEEANQKLVRQIQENENVGSLEWEVASEKQFQQLFENMEQGFALHEMVYDSNGVPYDYRFILINKAFNKLTVENAYDFIGKTVKQVLPAVEPIWIANYGKVATTGEPMQFEHYSQEFDKYYNVMAYSPKKNFFATIFTDITDVKLKSKQLQEAKEKAEESEYLKSAFLANMSHEIRTPMNGILGFAQLLKEPNLSSEEKSQYISIIENSGKRLLKTVNDLIDFSKIDAGQMKVSISIVNINELLEKLLFFFRIEAEKKGIELVLDTSLSDITTSILSDNEKLYSILTNLIKNAIKYTPSGKIEFGYEKQKKNLLFFVKDTGDGISKQRLGVIFERFIRGDNHENSSLEGAGLGLSISKAYVEMLGGEIWAESEVGEGSQFYFTLPLDSSINKLQK